MNFSLLLYKTQTVKPYKRYRKLFLKESAISSKQNAAKHKSCDLCCYRLLKGYECSEVEFRYNTKTTQENLYQKLLKLIRENPIKFN